MQLNIRLLMSSLCSAFVLLLMLGCPTDPRNGDNGDPVVEEVPLIDEPLPAISLVVNETYQLSSTNANLTWSSSSSAVATVNNDGLVTARSLGRATITATDGEEEAAVVIRVINSNSVAFLPQVSERHTNFSFGSAASFSSSDGGITYNSNETSEVAEGNRAISINWRANTGVALLTIEIPQDLSAYTHFAFSMRATAQPQLKLIHGDNRESSLWLNNITEGELDGCLFSSASSKGGFGETAGVGTYDDRWHDLVIPLDQFVRANNPNLEGNDPDIEKTEIIGFGFYAEGIGTVYFDNIRFEGPAEAAFSPANFRVILITDSDTVQVRSGATYQLEANIIGEGAPSSTLGWESSDTNVATVDATGLVTAVAGGTTTITVTIDGTSMSDMVDIEVITGIEFTERTPVITLARGQTYELNPDVFGFNNPTLNWNHSDLAVATVDSSGLVSASAVSNGTSRITVTIDGTEKSDSILVRVVGSTLGFLSEVSEVSPTSFGSVDSTTLSGFESGNVTFNKNETDEVGEGSRGLSLTWSANAVGIINIEPAQDISSYTHLGFSIRAPGGADLQLKIAEGPNDDDEKGNIWLNEFEEGVLDGVPFSGVRGFTTDAENPFWDGEWHDIVIPLDAMDIAPMNDPTDFGNLDQNNVAGFGFWSQDNPRTVYLDNIRFEGPAGALFTERFAVRINEVGPISLGTGAMRQLTATIIGRSPQSNFIWSSSATNIATVNSNNGLVTGVGDGLATITVSVGTTGVRDTVMVQVSSGLELSYEVPVITLTVGQTYTLAHQVFGFDSPTLTWSSSSNAVATVNTSGAVTAAGLGTTTITVVLNAENSDSILVSVVSNALGFLSDVSEVFSDSYGDADSATYTSKDEQGAGNPATFNSNVTDEVGEGSRGISIDWPNSGVALITTSATNLSSYTHFAFSFRAPDPRGMDGGGLGLQIKITEGTTNAERGNIWFGDITEGEFDGMPFSGGLSDQDIADGDWHDVVIPLSIDDNFDNLDKTQITGFGFWQGHNDNARTVYLDNIRFERR